MNYHESFFQNKNIAVVGTSRNKHKFGYMIFKELRKRKLNPIPINPHTDEIEGIKCYRSITDCPENIDTVITVIPSVSALDVAKESNSKGIKNLWFQQGSESKDAIEFCKQNEMNFVAGKCVLMYLEPVRSIHKFHRFIARLFGKY